MKDLLNPHDRFVKLSPTLLRGTLGRSSRDLHSAYFSDRKSSLGRHFEICNTGSVVHHSPHWVQRLRFRTRQASIDTLLIEVAGQSYSPYVIRVKIISSDNP